MKKALSVILALCVSLSLAACGAASKPDSVVDELCKAMQSMDDEAMSACFENGNSGMDNATSDTEIEEDLAAQQMTDYFAANAAKITYTIGETVIDEDTATVPVSFTYVDASTVIAETFADYISQALTLAFSGADDAAIEELFGTIFAEKAKTAKTGTATADVVFNCVKTNDVWKISELSEETAGALMDVMTSKITSTFKGLYSGETDETISENTVWHDVPLGEAVELATVKLCITGCEELSELTAEYLEAEVAQEGTKFVVFSADIENITKDTLNFNNDLSLTDSQGRTYNAYDGALWYYDEAFSYTELSPNIKKSGYLVYNVPSDSEGYYLSVAKSGTDDAYKLYAE